MKAHIGADAASGLVHTLVTTAANVHDVNQAHALLHGEEQQDTVILVIWGLTNGKKIRIKMWSGW